MTDDDTTLPTVLIVEDDASLAEEMSISLRHHGLRPILASGWDQALAIVEAQTLDAIVLDQRLGPVDAVPRLPRLRMLTSAPIVMLTANQSEVDRILALEIGADDFLIKPISGRELVARIRAHLRRSTSPTEAGNVTGTIRRRWQFSIPDRRLTRPDGTLVPLTGAEFDLLARLVQSAGQPIDRETLTRTVLGRTWRPEERAIDNLVLHVRQKLGHGGDRSIVTIRNQGYVFTAFPDT